MVSITTLTMGFLGRVFFSHFFRPSILGGISESVDSRAGDERDGVDEMGCRQSHGFGISAQSDLKMKLSKEYPS